VLGDEGPLFHHRAYPPRPAPADRGDPGRGLDADPVLDRGRRRRGRDDVHAVRLGRRRATRPAHRPPRPPTPGSQLALFALYDYHAFITDREGETLGLEADHRRHAEVENAIRDLKEGVRLNHLPSGKFAANAAWLAVQAIAHNLARWTARLGLGAGIVTTKTLRRRFLALAGRLVRSARRVTLRLAGHWPWRAEFLAALGRLRAIPLLA